jgi:predicted O-methyltransferase YrrM
MLGERDRIEIARLWERKLRQDNLNLPLAERHRNLEPASAEFLCALAAGIGAGRILEIGGSSGLSTISLAAAARQVRGQVTSIEKEPQRQAEARQTLAQLDLAPYVKFILGDAASVLESAGEFDLVFIDCEKEDYIRFFDILHVPAGGLVVADNIISHSLTGYVVHVRAQPGVESVTLPIGKGLEVTRFTMPSRHNQAPSLRPAQGRL